MLRRIRPCGPSSMALARRSHVHLKSAATLDSSQARFLRLAMIVSRFVLALCLAGLLAPPASGEEGLPHRHALSLIGTPKYPADFTQFNYVNPDAPKGGLVRMADIG